MLFEFSVAVSQHHMLLVEGQFSDSHGAVNRSEADGALNANHATEEYSRSQSWLS